MSIGIFYKGRSEGYYTSNNYNANKDFFEDKNTSDELKKYLDIKFTKDNIIKKIESKDTLLLKHFQFILINNVNCTEKDKITTKKDKYDFHEWAVMLNFSDGLSYFNFKELSNKTLPLNTRFSDAIRKKSFGYTYSDFGNYNVGKIEIFERQKNTNGNFKYNLSGYSISESYGYSPHISNRFTFGIYATLAYQRLVLATQNDSLNQIIVPGFSKDGSNKFINHGLGAGAGLDLRFAISSWLGIFARGKYMFDISKKYWNPSGTYNNLSISSPRTSLDNYGFNFGLSILIQE